MRLLVPLLVLSLVAPFSRADEPIRRTWLIDGVEREALVSAPTTVTTTPAPLVFLFHGRTSKAGITVNRYALRRRWPEAVVVSPQGLILPCPDDATEVRLVHEFFLGPDHPDGKGRPADYGTGWQMVPGQDGDRDLKFFDALLSSIRHDYHIDEKRIYAAGHSNGAMFTYLLWATRGDTFAAVAPTAGAILPAVAPLLKPKPVFILAGEKDKLVKITWQTDTIDFIRILDGCAPGRPVGPHLTLYPSPAGTPLLTCVHPGGHGFPDADPAIADALVAFLRDQTLPAASVVP